MLTVSVVMSVYNGGKYLKEAIESVLSQTMPDFEFIIINDGSTDKSLDIIKEFEKKDKRIKVISHENLGLIYSLNEGIKLAQGEYIARMDADDISLPNRFAQQINYFKNNPKDVLLGSYATKIDELNNKIGDFNYLPLTWEKIKKYSLLHNPFIHPSIMFKRELINEVGCYRNFKYAEDYELWTRIIYKYPCANIKEPLLQYRVHSEQITDKKKFKSIIVRLFALFRFLFS